jgi:hypothetical protein
MATKDSQNLGQGDAPSADEIIEALAQEMGVDEAKEEAPAPAPAEESDAAAEPAVEEAAAPVEEAPAKKKDAMPDLGGIFDVPGGGNAEKAKKPKKDAAKGDAPKKKKGASEVEGIFDVGGGGGASAPVPEQSYDPVIDDDEPIKTGGGTTKLLIAIIAFLIVAMVGGGLYVTGKFEDVLAVANGTYRDKKDAAKRKIEEDHRKAMLAALKKYGTLNILGAPDKALVRMQFDGDSAPRIVYAPFSENSPFTELRLPTTFQNLEVDKPISVLVAAPGYRSNQLTVREENWQEVGLRDYTYSTTMYLEAQSGGQEELTDRMEPHEEDFHGKIVVESNPPGAFIKLNGLQLFKDGQPLRTPAVITEYPILSQVHVDAMSAEARTKQQLCDKGAATICEEAQGLVGKAKALQTKLAERKKAPEVKMIKVNTPPDIGDKVEVYFNDSAMPRYVTSIWRRLWTCTPKSDKDISRLAKDARPVLKCDYSYKIAGKDVTEAGKPAPSAVADFEAIKVEIKRRKAVELEMAQQAAERDRLKKEADKALKESLGK